MRIKVKIKLKEILVVLTILDKINNLQDLVDSLNNHFMPSARIGGRGLRLPKGGRSP